MRGPQAKANPRSLCLPVRGAAPFAGLILFLAWLPIIEACRVSLGGPGKVILDQEFSSAAYINVLNDAAIMQASLRSLLIGLGCALISILFGGAVAVAAHTMGGKMKSWITSFYLFPLVTPDVMIGLALNHAAAELGIPINVFTLSVAHSTFGSALCFFVITAAITGEVKSALDSALTLGLWRFRHLLSVLQPLLLSGFIAAACVTFVVSLDDFGVTYFIVRPGQATLPVTLFTRLSKGLTAESFAAACALALVNGVIVVKVLRSFGLKAFGLSGMDD